MGKKMNKQSNRQCIKYKKNCIREKSSYGAKREREILKTMWVDMAIAKNNYIFLKKNNNKFYSFKAYHCVPQVHR
jgi:hypothetical protein